MNYHSLALLAVLWLAAPVRAALPANLDKPYQVDVVLQVAPDRVLTDIFQQQLARELNDLLRQAFGNLAQVNVKTDHPQLKAGGDLLQALGALKETGPVKTHVVRVDFVGGQFYQIESAQHDGLTGLVSPVVQQARTADRPLVGKLAAELVYRDLGIIGSVVDARDPERVKVALQGSRLGGDRLVKEGDVFAIAQVGRGGSQVVPEAYLQAIEAPKDGMVTCLLLARFADDASKLKELPGGFLGYRCLKLNAVQAALRLRIVDDQGQPLDGVRVEVARAAASSREAKGLTDRDGLVDTRATYDRMALVWVLHEDTARARIPVPIFADRVAVCRVRIDMAGQVHDGLRLRNRALGDLVNGLLLSTNQLFRDLNELTRTGQHAEALAKARAGLKVIQQGLPELRREYAGLRGEIVRLLPAAQQGRLLDASGMKQLETAKANLESFVVAQQEVLQEMARRQEAQAEILNLINQARLACDQADYDDAIPLYEKALAKAGQHAKLAQELASLKARWTQAGGPLHQRARDFLYRVWAKIDNADKLHEHLDEVKKQLAICQQHGDVLALTKFLVVYPAQAKRLEMLLANQRRDTEEGFKRYERFDALADELVKLHREISEFVLEKAGK